MDFKYHMPRQQDKNSTEQLSIEKQIWYLEAELEDSGIPEARYEEIKTHILQMTNRLNQLRNISE